MRDENKKCGSNSYIWRARVMKVVRQGLNHNPVRVLRGKGRSGSSSLSKRGSSCRFPSVEERLLEALAEGVSAGRRQYRGEFRNRRPDGKHRRSGLRSPSGRPLYADRPGRSVTGRVCRRSPSPEAANGIFQCSMISRRAGSCVPRKKNCRCIAHTNPSASSWSRVDLRLANI